MKKVTGVEFIETVNESIKKSKRHDYVKGGYKIEQIILKEIVVLPHMILECGHSRKVYPGMPDIRNAKRLSCRVCES